MRLWRTYGAKMLGVGIGTGAVITAGFRLAYSITISIATPMPIPPNPTCGILYRLISGHRPLTVTMFEA